jgi:hypothetical protein
VAQEVSLDTYADAVAACEAEFRQEARYGHARIHCPALNLRVRLLITQAIAWVVFDSFRRSQRLKKRK